MPEKSAAAAQTASSRPLVKSTKPESLAQRFDELYQQIARRAYELFESHGHAHGHDVEHWLGAESAIIHPVHVQLEDNASDYELHAEVPGFSANELEIHVEPQRVIITGSRESKSDSKKGGTIVTEECSNEIYRTISLPGQVDTSKVTSSLKNGILDITLPKLAPSKSIEVEPKGSKSIPE
jgi:HSP20 family protein